MNEERYTKEKWVSEVAEKTGLSKNKSKDIIDAVFATLGKALEGGKHAMLPGIGSLCLKKRPKREGRNPRTGEPLTIPAKDVLRFRMSSQFGGKKKK